MKLLGSDKTAAYYMERSSMGTKLDLTGQVFKHLEVLEPAPNIGKRTAWICRCLNCGKLTTVQTKYLRNGHVTSCGCHKPPIESRMHFVDGTCIEMLKAETVRKNNKSGVPGVFWSAADRCWRAQIGFKKKSYSLGRFKRKDDAIRVRRRAEKEIHGEFLKWYAGLNADRKAEVSEKEKGK